MTVTTADTTIVPDTAKVDAGVGSRAEAAVQKFLAVTDSAIASYLDACVHCGECSEACHFYLSTHDPRYTPIFKLKPLVKAYKRHKAPFSTLTRAVGLAPAELTFEELEEWSVLAYDSCNMCGRCTLVCPMGIDIAGSVRKMREGFVAADLAPEGLRSAEANALASGSPMNITPKTLKAVISRQEKETGIPVALDKKGADYMVILSAMEVMGFSEVSGRCRGSSPRPVSIGRSQPRRSRRRMSACRSARARPPRRSSHASSRQQRSLASNTSSALSAAMPMARCAGRGRT